MSDEATTENGNGGASDSASTADPANGCGGGGGSEGGSGGGAPADDQFAGERARLEKAARDQQSRADRLQAQLDRFKAAAEPEAPKGGEPASASTDVGLLFDLRDERDRLASEFPDADAGILARYRTFSSPEELRMAVEQSATAAASLRERLEREAEEKVRKEYEERHGPLRQDPPAARPGATGLPSIDQLAAMSVRELDEVDAKHGAGTVERILAEATRQASA